MWGYITLVLHVSVCDYLRSHNVFFLLFAVLCYNLGTTLVLFLATSVEMQCLQPDFKNSGYLIPSCHGS